LSLHEIKKTTANKPKHKITGNRQTEERILLDEDISTIMKTKEETVFSFFMKCYAFGKWRWLHKPRRIVN